MLTLVNFDLTNVAMEGIGFGCYILIFDWGVKDEKMI